MGKTAAVEGLAQRIVAGDVPVALMGVKILELDLGSLSAGCMMPGQGSSRYRLGSKLPRSLTHPASVASKAWGLSSFVSAR